MNLFHTIAVARASLPRLTLAQRVVDKMVRNALVYSTETGESLVGFAVKGLQRAEPDLYVIETIAPDESAIRRGAYFEQGDDLQGDIFAWWYNNWELYRRWRKSARKPDGLDKALEDKLDVPLVHLGDWHKHPGTLIEPSWGDTDTARGHIADKSNHTPQLLAILATVWDRSEDAAFAATEPPDPNNEHPKPIRVPIDDRNVVRLDCWYISRSTRRFVRLSPTVVPDDMLPKLPTLGWHLVNLDRLRHEMALLSGEGFSVSVDEYDVDHVPPQEVCIFLARPTSAKVLIVVTQADYPDSRPTLRIAPMNAIQGLPEDADLYQSLWERSEPLPKEAEPTWPWNADHTILDLVRDVEARLKEGSAVR
ncbi:MAG TPA: hypothetical protein VKQ72_11295 [Aggregatilineales bacterium]|nr:hypothetical protein [Aggregatilineales bacterium]